MRARRFLHLALLVLAGIACRAEGAMAEERYRLTAGPGADSLVTPTDSTWTREQLEAVAARARDLLFTRGRIGAVVKLTLAPGRDQDSVKVARISIERGETPSSVLAVVRGAEGLIPDGAEVFQRASQGRGEPRDLMAGLEALRVEAQARGRYGAEAVLDSAVLIDPTTARVYVRLDPGPPVTVDSLDLGSASVRGSVVGSISGLTKGRVLTPAVLEDARERLMQSELFASVGDLAVVPGAEPGRARIVAPLVENRLSRFEGAVGVQSGGGVTGLFDLALGNIGGSGRSAGARWAGYGDGRSDYAARYREPALFGTGLDGALALEAQVQDSLYTETQWSLELSGRPWDRVRAGATVRRSGSAYTGAGRGTSTTWSLEGRFSWRGLTPAQNPVRGFSASVAGEAGRRSELYPGYARATRRILRGSLGWEAAYPTGPTRALYASMRAEQVSLGEGALPAEELRFLGGSEGLRGHRDRAFAGDRVLAMSLEHRWLTGPRGGRVFLFVDGARHELGSPVEAGTASGLPDSGASLARTELSPGWEFGYGAGLRNPIRAGTVGIELGLRPGAPLREGTVHLRYTTDW
jgi:outer membrane protein assembly factor BamA